MQGLQEWVYGRVEPEEADLEPGGIIARFKMVENVLAQCEEELAAEKIAEGATIKTSAMEKW